MTINARSNEELDAWVTWYASQGFWLQWYQLGCVVVVRPRRLNVGWLLFWVLIGWLLIWIPLLVYLLIVALAREEVLTIRVVGCPAPAMPGYVTELPEPKPATGAGDALGPDDKGGQAELASRC